MFAFKKNQVVITALVVMIAAAGYLNYMDSVPSDTSQVMLVDGDSVDGVLSEDTAEVISPDENIEIAQVSEENEDTASADIGDDSQEVANSDAGTAVFVSSGSESSYFVQAKLEREQARAKEKDLLNEMINNDKMDGQKKSDAADQMLEIQKRIEKETAAESMIEAKGFKEAYVRIDDDTVDVVVDRQQLTDSEIAQIEDIVKRKTGVGADKIRISPLRGSTDGNK
jgi:stage III sporulation protein AH